LQRRGDPSEAARTTADPWRDLAAEPYYIRREPGDPAGSITEPSPQEYADAWRDFGRQPGTRLSWVRTGTLRRELRTTDQQTVVSFRYAAIAANWPSPTSIVGNHRLSAGGRTFTLKRVTPSAWPGIATTISRDRLGADRKLQHQTDDRDPFLRQHLDDTGIAVLYRGGKHIERNAGSYVKFPGQRWLRFPVRGTKRANAITTAVDQAGNKVARYQFAGCRKAIEIALHPDQRLTEEQALTIAVSASWIDDFFSREGGGG